MTSRPTRAGLLQLLLLAVLVTPLALPWPGAAAAPPAAAADGQARDALRPWAARIDDALARLRDGDLAGARAGLEAFRTAWPEIEDPIRATSRSHYREIERATGDAQVALATQPPDRAAAQAALERLQAVNAAFLAGTAVPGGAAAAAAPGVSNPTPATLVELLDGTLAALDRGDVT